MTGQIKNAIRQLRFAHGEMTQAELAEKVEVSRQTIVAIEKAKYSPSLELGFRIAAVFGVEIGEVFWYEYQGDVVQKEDALRRHCRDR